MQKIFLSFLFILFFIPFSTANDDITSIKKFFNIYVDSANNYKDDYFDYYCPNAKIIRVVEKDDGTLESVNIPLERYKKEAKKSRKLARLRKYKNTYFNIEIIPFGSDYKLTTLRMPSTSDYKIPAHFIIGKDSAGNWKIKEESMNTKVQKFLKNN